MAENNPAKRSKRKLTYLPHIFDLHHTSFPCYTARVECAVCDPPYVLQIVGYVTFTKPFIRSAVGHDTVAHHAADEHVHVVESRFVPEANILVFQLRAESRRLQRAIFTYETREAVKCAVRNVANAIDCRQHPHVEEDDVDDDAKRLPAALTQSSNSSPSHSVASRRCVQANFCDFRAKKYFIATSFIT